MKAGVMDRSCQFEKDISKTNVIEALIELGISKETLEDLSPAIEETILAEYAPGETIFHEGAETVALYVLRRGRVKMLNYLENGRARIIRLYNRGDIFGLKGLIDKVHRHTTEAISGVEVYQIPLHLIKNIEGTDPETYCQILRYWHGHLNMADTWIIDFSTGSVIERVARLLQFLVNLDSAGSADVSEVTLLTVEEMANVLGVTPESVSRVMADLKRKNILVIAAGPDSHIYQCDVKRLLLEAGLL